MAHISLMLITLLLLGTNQWDFVPFGRIVRWGGSVVFVVRFDHLAQLRVRVTDTTFTPHLRVVAHLHHFHNRAQRDERYDERHTWYRGGDHEIVPRLVQIMARKNFKGVILKT